MDRSLPPLSLYIYNEYKSAGQARYSHKIDIGGVG
jgi:hypothetical protein